MNELVKTPDQEIQRKTSIFLQIVYMFLYTILAVPLIVCGILGLGSPNYPNSAGEGYTHWQGPTEPNQNGSSIYVHKGSYIAMIVVGAVFLVAVLYSIFLTIQMIKQMKNDGKFSETSEVMMGITLNFYGLILAKTANGKLRSSEEKKADKAAKKEKKAAKKSAKQKSKPTVATTTKVEVAA